MLIISSSDDVHASTVLKACQNLGREDVNFWSTESTFNNNYLSVYPEGGLGNNEFNFDCSFLNYNNNGSVWLRRPIIPLPVKNSMISEDEVVEQERRMFFLSLFSTMEDKALWINPVSSKYISESKILQLEIAKKSGLVVPRTIFSNNIDHIICFMNQLNIDHVVFKTLTPCSWKKNGLAYGVYTSLVHVNQLNGALIQNSVSIWQEPIAKDYELRLTIFGNTCIAAKIHSQENLDSLIDWRQGAKVSISPASVPDDLFIKCKEVMVKLGIVFGAFDFIVTKSGDYVFLEVNESGQFLWVEERCPDIPMLDAFVSFFCSSDPKFQYESNARRLFLSDF